MITDNERTDHWKQNSELSAVNSVLTTEQEDTDYWKWNEEL